MHYARTGERTGLARSWEHKFIEVAKGTAHAPENIAKCQQLACHALHMRDQASKRKAHRERLLCRMSHHSRF